MNSKPFGPKIAKMVANVDGPELARRGVSVIAWDETTITVAGDGEILVQEQRSELISRYRWTGRRFAYQGANHTA